MIPLGDILNFLDPGQAISAEQLQARAERADVNNSLYCPPTDEEILQSSVNFVMSPTKSYFSPLESLFPDISAEQGFEAMFNMDLLRSQ